MVKLVSERLSQSYLNLVAIKNALVYVQEQTFRRHDDNFLNALGFPYIGELSKDRKEFVGTRMDIMLQSIEGLIVLGLVADFEKIVFERVDNAHGEISKIVKKGYSSKPFKDFSADFVKSTLDIDKLSAIKAIVRTKLPEELTRKFSEVIDFRNHIAHGKRFGEQSLMTFDEIAETLDDVLNYV